MKQPDKTNKDDAQTGSADDAVGDVETAGETTAAAAITGPTDTSPVGADTMLKVADAPEGKED
jgi:hypothetical protein